MKKIRCDSGMSMEEYKSYFVMSMVVAQLARSDSKPVYLYLFKRHLSVNKPVLREANNRQR